MWQMTDEERERRRQECVRKVRDCERDFVHHMQFGIQRYSQPLQHCIISQADHALLFQNVDEVGSSWFNLWMEK